ncbi:hypothetical protein CBR_g4154 [Chara braunii]|uniref:DDE Tnp4 domain-containing protein n=1 Tax=Chara braunii TaxID=69332 RepID=A0A388KHE5_CHABU|nr:hypothetical protein CBR_g4154 [Chara braunii]|eukprot:GBG69459.1 hypothetical protein CBR_g4154 [Chara braunii]
MRLTKPFPPYARSLRHHNGQMWIDDAPEDDFEDDPWTTVVPYMNRHLDERNENDWKAMERSFPWASHYKFANMLEFGSLIALPTGVLHRKTLDDKGEPVHFRTSFKRRLHCEYITSSPRTWGSSQRQELEDCARHCSFLEHYPPRCPGTSPQALSYCCVHLTNDGCPFARVLCVASSSKSGKLVDAVVLVSRNEMVLRGSRFKAVMSCLDVDGRPNLVRAGQRADFPLLTYFENMVDILGYIEIKVPERLTIITKGGAFPFQYDRIFRIVAGGGTMFVIMVRFTDLNILDMRIYERRGENWMRGDFTRAYVKALEVLFALRRAVLGAGGDIQGFSFSIMEFKGYCYDNQTKERQEGNRMLGDFTAPYLQAADVLVSLRRAVVMAGGDVQGFSISITGFEGFLISGGQNENTEGPGRATPRWCMKRRTGGTWEDLWQCDDVMADYFMDKMRTSRRVFREITKALSPFLQRRVTFYREPLQPDHIAAYALYRWASGETYECGTCSFGIRKSSTLVDVRDVTAALRSAYPNKISWPTGLQKTIVLRAFDDKGFHNCHGCIECTHIFIDKPLNCPGEDYYDRKWCFSIQALVVVDLNLRMLDVFISFPGSCHDVRIVHLSSLWACAEAGGVFTRPPAMLPFGVQTNGYLLGDNGYLSSEWVVVPYDSFSQHPWELRFDNKQKTARGGVEKAFGRLKGMWRLFLRSHKTNIETLPQQLVAVCILHNIPIDHHCCDARHTWSLLYLATPTSTVPVLAMAMNGEVGRDTLSKVERMAVAAAVNAILFQCQLQRSEGRMRATIRARRKRRLQSMNVEGEDSGAICNVVLHVCYAMGCGAFPRATPRWCMKRRTGGTWEDLWQCDDVMADYFKDKMRTSPRVFREITKALSPFLQRRVTFYREPLQPDHIAAYALYRWASGETYESGTCSFGICRSSALVDVRDVTAALLSAYPDKISWPTGLEWRISSCALSMTRVSITAMGASNAPTSSSTSQ